MHGTNGTFLPRGGGGTGRFFFGLAPRPFYIGPDSLTKDILFSFNVKHLKRLINLAQATKWDFRMSCVKQMMLINLH